MEAPIMHLHDIFTNEERERFRLWLQRQFTERCKQNPRYSLRSFAKYLEIDPSTVSQILSGKRAISKKMMGNLCQKLAMWPLDGDYEQVKLDQFMFIADWYHYAILELTFVTGFRPDPRWIARQLSISVDEAKAALERLLRLGLLAHKDGTIVKTVRHTTNHADFDTSEAHREYQRQIIKKAVTAIDTCVPAEKDITSITMAIDVKNLDRARDLIRRFRRDLCAILEDGEPTRVFTLAIQLYPVSLSSEVP